MTTTAPLRVEPRRTRKRTAKEVRAREQKRLVAAVRSSTQRVETAVKARRAVWPEGADPYTVGKRVLEIDHAFAERREVRRDVSNAVGRIA